VDSAQRIVSPQASSENLPRDQLAAVPPGGFVPDCRGDEMTRGEAQQVIVEFLMERVRDDHYPSTTQMSMIEQMLPPEMVPDYLDILMDKLVEDTWPSTDMLRRIRRVAETLPASEQRR
jgi:hypothetical protein